MYRSSMWWPCLVMLNLAFLRASACTLCHRLSLCICVCVFYIIMTGPGKIKLVLSFLTWSPWTTEPSSALSKLCAKWASEWWKSNWSWASWHDLLGLQNHHQHCQSCVQNEHQNDENQTGLELLDMISLDYRTVISIVKAVCKMSIRMMKIKLVLSFLTWSPWTTEPSSALSKLCGKWASEWSSHLSVFTVYFVHVTGIFSMLQAVSHPVTYMYTVCMLTCVYMYSRGHASFHDAFVCWAISGSVQWIPKGVCSSCVRVCHTTSAGVCHCQ